jgi:hypothetical protein
VVIAEGWSLRPIVSISLARQRTRGDRTVACIGDPRQRRNPIGDGDRIGADDLVAHDPPPTQGFVPNKWLLAPFTVQTRPAPRTTGGRRRAGVGAIAQGSRAVCASFTSTEFGSTARGEPPITKRRSSTAAMRPPRKDRPERERDPAVGVQRVGWRSTF